MAVSYTHLDVYKRQPEALRDVIAGAGFQIEALEEQTHYAFPFIHLIVYLSLIHI